MSCAGKNYMEENRKQGEKGRESRAGNWFVPVLCRVAREGMSDKGTFRQGPERNGAWLFWLMEDEFLKQKKQQTQRSWGRAWSEWEEGAMGEILRICILFWWDTEPFLQRNMMFSEVTIHSIEEEPMGRGEAGLLSAGADRYWPY